MKTVYFFKKDMRNVTEYYYSIILSALRRNNVEIKELDIPNTKRKLDIPKTDYILITTLQDFMRLYLKGYRNFIYWFQGITPEEHFMMQHKKWKYYMFSFLEKMALKKSKYKIGVSKYLFEHYNNKYGLNICNNDVYIMPCYNSELKKENFYIRGKYLNNTFCFAGGMQPWQGFENILLIYSQIEQKYNNVFLKVYSKELDAAKTLIEKYNLKNYSVDSVSQEDMEKVLSDCKFGFIIRENNIINNVATPTKLATYIGNGIIPIFTSTIHAFRDLSDKYNYLCCMYDKKDVTPLYRFMEEDIDADSIYKDYCRIFNDYFNTEKYIEELAHFFS